MKKLFLFISISTALLPPAALANNCAAPARAADYAHLQEALTTAYLYSFEAKSSQALGNPGLGQRCEIELGPGTSECTNAEDKQLAMYFAIKIQENNQWTAHPIMVSPAGLHLEVKVNGVEGTDNYHKTVKIFDGKDGPLAVTIHVYARTVPGKRFGGAIIEYPGGGKAGCEMEQ